MPHLWAEANQDERRRLLLTVLDAVYVDTKGNKAITAIKPKPPFRPIFQVAVTASGSGIVISGERPAVPAVASGLIPVAVAAN